MSLQILYKVANFSLSAHLSCSGKRFLSPQIVCKDGMRLVDYLANKAEDAIKLVVVAVHDR